MVSFNQVAFIIITILVSFLYRRYIDKEEKEQELRDLHIINSEFLKKGDKPILWIPVPRLYNARKWSSFYSRSSDTLNIPYMYLTIKSIMDKCGKSFKICVIDDDSFVKLLPNWTPDLDKIGDPLREKVRYLGMMELLYNYGGMIVPPSFLCLQDLNPLWNEIKGDDKALVAQDINYHDDSQYAPNPYFIGCEMECPVIKEFIDYLSILITKDYTAESIFLNSLSKWCSLRVKSGKMVLEDGSFFGVKDKYKDPVVMEYLFEEKPLDLMSKIYGILIPHEQIDKRIKYNWLCSLDNEELVNMNTDLGKYFAMISKNN